MQLIINSILNSSGEVQLRDLIEYIPEILSSISIIISIVISILYISLKKRLAIVEEQKLNIQKVQHNKEYTDQRLTIRNNVNELKKTLLSEKGLTFDKYVSFDINMRDANLYFNEEVVEYIDALRRDVKSLYFKQKSLIRRIESMKAFTDTERIKYDTVHTRIVILNDEIDELNFSLDDRLTEKVIRDKFKEMKLTI